MKRRWYHRWYVVELVPDHLAAGIMIAGERRRVCWTWSHRRAQKLAEWYNEGRSSYEVGIGVRCVVEPA